MAPVADRLEVYRSKEQGSHRGCLFMRMSNIVAECPGSIGHICSNGNDTQFFRKQVHDGKTQREAWCTVDTHIPKYVQPDMTLPEDRISFFIHLPSEENSEETNRCAS